MSENVISALAAVAAEIGAVGKTGKAAEKQGGYAYRKIDDVLNALHGPLAAHGVVLVPHVVDATQEPHGSNGWTRTTVTVEYRVFGPGGLEDRLPVEDSPRVVADGLDNGDKGYGKAMSYAYKTALGQLFTIPTEEDNEATDTPQEPKTRTTRSRPRQTPPRVPNGEPFAGSPEYAHPDRVQAVLDEAKNSTPEVKEAFAAYFAEKELPKLSDNKDRYPAAVLTLVEAKLTELQDKADGK